MKTLLPRLLLFLSLAALSGVSGGCNRSGGRGRIIPKPVMVSIFADMFLADRWLLDHPDFRPQADTSDFYGAIFHRYGYSFADYDASIRVYLQDPEKFSAMFKQVSDKLKRSGRYYASLQERLAGSEDREVRSFQHRFQNILPEDFLWFPLDTNIVYRELAVADSLDTDDDADHIPVFDTWDDDTTAVCRQVPVTPIPITDTISHKLWNTQKDSATLRRRRPLPEAFRR